MQPAPTFGTDTTLTTFGGCQLPTTAATTSFVIDSCVRKQPVCIQMGKKPTENFNVGGVVGALAVFGETKIAIFHNTDIDIIRFVVRPSKQHSKHGFVFRLTELERAMVAALLRFDCESRVTAEEKVFAQPDFVFVRFVHIVITIYQLL